ncbi:Hypp7166 [Branchiostoma lanceolatum]|uniref:Hypp7166 protein n=1 Tax=Branchiostoma lanceolatum TaxID=7740 RepID=A0A8K0ECR2_BRALA|nr:Hypp7166 [Branchiostoma lanceolatum]
MQNYLFFVAVLCTLAAIVTGTCEWSYSCEDYRTQCCRKNGGEGEPFSVYWYPGLTPEALGECGELGKENEICFTGMSIDYCTCAEGLSCQPAPGSPPESDVVIGFFTYVLHTCQPNTQ